MAQRRADRASGWRGQRPRLAGATGDEIWREAATRRAIVVSKDADFSARLPLSSFVVLLRIGNCTTATAVDLVLSNLSRISAAIADGSRLIELG